MMNSTALNGIQPRTLRHSGTTVPTLALLAGVLLLPALDAGAVGFRLPDQDPAAISRGNAFAATADNPSAIFYNPAGITQIPGQEVSVGTYIISSGIKYDGPNGTHAQVNSTPQPIPQLYYTCSPKNLPVSFGLGVYAPYGLATEWGENSPFRYASIYGKMLYISVNPVVAWKICDQLSIAAGPTINYSKAKLTKGISPFSNTDTFHLVGDDTAFGFNAGLLWKPVQQLAFGLNYRSRTDLNYKGSASFNPYLPGAYDTTASVKLPQNAVGGISYRPTEKWNFEFDLDWTEWDVTKAITFSGVVPIADFPLNLKNSFMYEFGVTRQLDNGWWVSAGYFYSENSFPNESFNPVLQDANLSLGSVGLGHKGQRWDWAVAYQFGYNPGRVVSGSVWSTPQQPVDGTYRSFNQAVNVSLAYKF